MNAANLLLVLGARVRGNVDGQAAALIVLVLASAEAVIGLGVALALFRDRDRADVDEPARGARMSAVLLWAWLFTIPGLLLTAFGVGKSLAPPAWAARW